MTGHWVQLKQDTGSRWRSVCECGWLSEPRFDPAEAVEDGLAHSSATEAAYAGLLGIPGGIPQAQLG